MLFLTLFSHEFILFCRCGHRRTGRGGAGGGAAAPPPKKITKSKSRANVQHKSGKSGKLKSQKAPSLLGKQRQSGNIRFTVGQYWLFFGGGGRSPKLICSTNNFFGTGRAQSEKVGQISFRPPNFFLPVRPWLRLILFCSGSVNTFAVGHIIYSAWGTKLFQAWWDHRQSRRHVFWIVYGGINGSHHLANQITSFCGS